MPFCFELLANFNPQEFVDLLIYFLSRKMEKKNKVLLFIYCCLVQEKNGHITAKISVSWSEINSLFPILSTCQQWEHCDDPSDIVLAGKKNLHSGWLVFKSGWLLTSASSISRAERFLLTGQTHEQMVKPKHLCDVCWDGLCVFTDMAAAVGRLAGLHLTPVNNVYVWGIKLTHERNWRTC